MASITKQKGKRDTTWKVRIRMPNSPTITKTFSSMSNARRWARQTEDAIERGEYFEEAEASRHTVDDLIARYKDEELQKLSESEWRNRERHFTWWSKKVGKLPLSKLKPARIVECKQQLISSGLKGSTINRYMATLRVAFTVALKEWGWVAENPFSRVRQEKESPPIVRFLSPEERSQLLTTSQEHSNKNIYPIVLIALSTGMRQGEILGMRWSDIDFKRKTIIIPKTKNGSIRVVPLVGKAATELKKLSKVRKINNSFVFCGTNDEPLKFPENAWREAKTGINNFRFHDCRHSAASELAMNGASLHEIAAVLGHKTLQMVQRYAHLSEQHTIDVVERMNKAVFSE